MALKFPYRPKHGDLIDPKGYLQNLEAEEHKFAGNIDASDLKAKWYRFAICIGERNADGGSGTGSIPDVTPFVWFQTKAVSPFIIEQWTLAVQSMAETGQQFTIRVERKAAKTGWSSIGEITFTWHGIPAVVTGAPIHPVIQAGWEFRFYCFGSFRSLRSPTFVLWCKQILQEE